MIKSNYLDILLYHGVTTQSPSGIINAHGKHMNVSEFKKQLRYIKEHCNPISLEEALFYHERGSGWPDRSVVITFDDGFENNYSIAAPLLDEFNIPAIFYISPGIINTEKMFWVDQIESIINFTNKSKLKVTMNKKEVFDLTSLDKKLKALTEIKRFCKKASRQVRNDIISMLSNDANHTPTILDSIDYKSMTWKQVNQISSNSLFDIGGHTMHHDILTSVSIKSACSDIDETIESINKNLNINCRHFSYPEGQAEHFNQEIIKHIKTKNVKVCPSAIKGRVLKGDDPFYWKRTMPGFMGEPFPL